MKFSNQASKLEAMSDDEILDYLDNMQEKVFPDHPGIEQA